MRFTQTLLFSMLNNSRSLHPPLQERQSSPQPFSYPSSGPALSCAEDSRPDTTLHEGRAEGQNHLLHLAAPTALDAAQDAALPLVCKCRLLVHVQLFTLGIPKSFSAGLFSKTPCPSLLFQLILHISRQSRNLAMHTLYNGNKKGKTLVMTV